MIIRQVSNEPFTLYAQGGQQWFKAEMHVIQDHLLIELHTDIDVIGVLMRLSRIQTEEFSKWLASSLESA